MSLSVLTEIQTDGGWKLVGDLTGSELLMAAGGGTCAINSIGAPQSGLDCLQWTISPSGDIIVATSDHVFPDFAAHGVGYEQAPPVADGVYAIEHALSVPVRAISAAAQYLVGRSQIKSA